MKIEERGRLKRDIIIVCIFLQLTSYLCAQAILDPNNLTPFNSNKLLHVARELFQEVKTQFKHPIMTYAC